MLLTFLVPLLIQIIDAFVHIAANLIEPLRLIASVLLIFSMVLALWRPMPETRINVLRFGLIGYLVLNAIFIYRSGWPGPLLWVFVILTCVTTWLFYRKLASQGAQ